jgi:NADPH:quinone reductase-like Zn-dependent oxidoreductase
MPLRAIEAETFSGYGGPRQIELPKPQRAKDKVLAHVTAAGVTPLDHTILLGGHPRAKPPLVLGNEGAGVIADAFRPPTAPRMRSISISSPFQKAFGDEVTLRSTRAARMYEPGAWVSRVVADALADGCRKQRQGDCRRSGACRL